MSDIYVVPASFTGKSGTPIFVHFNPASLQYTVSNTLADQGKGKKQYVSQSTAKLTMDLVFDTTDSGTDVRMHTFEIAKLMEPGGPEGEGRTVPEIVTFEWGSFSFPGMLESFKETLDFFAPEGVPLRASVSISMSRQDKVFEEDPKMASKKHAPSVASLGSGQSAASAASAAGASNPASAARALGAINGLASLRAGGGAIALSGSVSLGASAGVGASAGGNLSVGASAGPLKIGGSASAGMTASSGAFAGLRASAGGAKATLKLDASALQPKLPSANVSASFGVGGMAKGGAGSSGAGANVGASASLKSQLSFED